MQKHKLSIIFYGIIIIFFFITPLKEKATNVCNKDFYNFLCYNMLKSLVILEIKPYLLFLYNFIYIFKYIRGIFI